MDLASLTETILQFREERDWAQFHTPRNLAAALAIEAAELQELMLWMTDDQVTELVDGREGHGRISDEIADVLIYALLLCDAAGVDPSAAVRIKLEKNATRYPVEKAKGSAKKYSEL